MPSRGRGWVVGPAPETLAGSAGNVENEGVGGEASLGATGGTFGLGWWWM
jgi:hypothetical protein